MKDTTLTQLLGLHAQVSGILLQLESLIDAEGGKIVQGCRHENAVDLSTMGMQPREKMYCLDCGLRFSGIGEEEE